MPGIYKSVGNRLLVPESVQKANLIDLNVRDPAKPPSLKFANFVTTDGFSVNALFHNLSPHRRKGAHEDSNSEYKQSYHRSMVKDGKRYSFNDMTVERPLRPVPPDQDPNKPYFKYPGRYNQGFRGLIPAEHAVTHWAKTGPVEAKTVIDSNMFVSVDPGVINTGGFATAAMTLEFNEDKTVASLKGEFVSGILKTDRYYSETTDPFTKLQNAAMKAFGDNTDHQSENHKRTTDIDKLEVYRVSYFESSDQIRLHNQDLKVLRQKRKSYSRKQRFWATIVNEILTQVDALRKRHPEKNRTPIILFGDGKGFQSKGHRSAPAQSLMRYLARFFPVVLIGEPYTSQQCSKCVFGKLEKIEEKGSTRHWFCKNPDCCSVNKDGSKYDKFIVHKDKSAPLNFTTIFASLLLTGKRPTAFCHPSEN